MFSKSVEFPSSGRFEIYKGQTFIAYDRVVISHGGSIPSIEIYVGDKHYFELISEIKIKNNKMIIHLSEQITTEEILKTFSKKKVRSVTKNIRKDGTIMLYFVQDYRGSDSVGWLSISQSQDWLDSDILSLDKYIKSIKSKEQ